MRQRQIRRRRGGGFPSLVAAGLLLIGLPTAGFAIGGAADSAPSLRSAHGAFASFTPASVDPDVARLVAERSNGKGRLMRFTPAGVASRPNRSVTVAVRVDDEAARAISVRSAISAAKEQVAGARNVQIAPARYNLGLSRGYQSFAQPLATGGRLADIDMPDLSQFKPESGTKEEPSRFAARIALQEDEPTGRAPRTLEGVGTQSLDVAGSYRLTRNLDVTAGLRLSQERDRLAPLTDMEEQDNQAVYVGTQFRF